MAAHSRNFSQEASIVAEPALLHLAPYILYLISVNKSNSARP